MNGKLLKKFKKTGCAIEKSLYLGSVNVIIKMMRYNENRDERPPAWLILGVMLLQVKF